VALNFDIAWELLPPRDGTYINSSVPEDAVESFYQILTKAANRTGDPEEVFYMIRAEFSTALGAPIYRSTSMYFAPADAKSAMDRAAKNAPAFLSAFHGVCEKIAAQFGPKTAPSVAALNRLLEINKIGYVIDPPDLRLREQIETVPIEPSSLLETAHARFSQAIERSHELLKQEKGDEAVSQIWWLLESIVPSFAGLEVDGETVKGAYFNEVTKSLKKLSGDAAVLGVVARWLDALQAYLSGPEEGGIRHGRALHMEGLKKHEAELFCNLTRSYIAYLLAEYKARTEAQ